jgi:flagellar biosynthesis/type III secretory pathway protein FliH
MEQRHTEGGEREQAHGEGARRELLPVQAALAGMKSELDELRARLDAAVTLLRRALKESSPSRPPSELFSRAEAFIEMQQMEAERRAAEVVSEAHEIAEAIIEDARARAMELADRTSNFLFIPPEVLERLEQSITSFAEANSEVAATLGPWPESA